MEEAARVVYEARHAEANIIFGAVIDPDLEDEVRITVITTGFAVKKELVTPGGKVVDLPRAARSSGAFNGQGGQAWRRRPAVEARAELGAAVDMTDELDVPTFLREADGLISA